VEPLHNLGAECEPQNIAKYWMRH